MDGTYHTMRALIDQGSQLSLITEKAAQILSLPRQKCKGVISGVGIKESNCKGQIHINCKSMDESYYFSIDVLIMKQLIRNLPNYTFQKPSWEYLEHIKLADPDFNLSRPVDILLGAEVYSHIILEGICRANQLTPIAQQTRLGWILCGNVNTLQCNVVLNNIDQIENFWKVEDIEEETTLSFEDLHCVKFYQETTTRLSDGKYKVKLPMDDLLHGAHTVDQAKQLQLDLIKLLKSGGFNLRKWSSNHESMLDNNYGKNEQDKNYQFMQVESTKTLGLSWNQKQDIFTFESKINQEYQAKVSKRALLSEISKIFDPLGWLTPTTTKLKLLFQQVWQTTCQWDDEIPQDLLAEWIKIKSDIQNINKIKVPRWLGTAQSTSVELHGYCDASIKAYACVIYCKINNTTTLVVSKSRVVSEKKKHTLPRLELCGAELLSRLMNKVEQCLTQYSVRVFGWTDSTAVLGWIQGDINRWKPFVAHRVSKITNIMKPECWRYVKSEDNPADCASRGITATQLKDHPLWWTGPSWLPTYQVEKQEVSEKYQTDQEAKKAKQVNVTTRETGEHSIIKQLLSKHSNWQKAVRVLAWVQRFISKKQARESNPYLSVKEKEKAKQSIIKHIQNETFQQEISNLKQGKQVSSKSKILSLNPYLDNFGLLRVGGRLRHANISENMKHPIIIPHDSRLTELLINQAHDLTFHGGVRLTLAYLRRKYWIIGGNRAVKKRLRTCVTCRKQHPSKQYQIMGDLPAARVNASRPFQQTGVDFTGHVEVKTNKGRGVKTTKGYIAVFICMATKAVHLELVSDMSSSAFLAALRRFSARRGSPHHIYSDNGTNFVGANNIIQKEFINIKQVLDEDFFTELSDMEIEWHFQAPSWPSAGGLWEAAVKSAKYHLRRALGAQRLTCEEFATLLSQIEACLNSRPLCAISEDPDDLNYLTPSHFLSSGPVLTIIETEHDQRTRWTLTQQIFKNVWQRWNTDYLTQLSVRSKWKSPQENIKINDVVLIHDTNLPAGKWCMGRVIELHPGKDGLVRVVTLKTKNGIIIRPTVKLSVLPASNQRTEATSKVEQVSVTSTHGEPDTRPPRRHRRKRTQQFFMPTIMSIVYYLSLLTLCFCQNIVKVNENQAIYFDKIASMQLIRDEWKIIVYNDMYPFWEGIQAYIEYSEHLETTCASLKKEVHCDVILLQLNHMYEELQHYNEILLRKQRPRQRRGFINGVGSAARSLFGVLDDEFAKQYARDISLIKQNENHLALLWKNQTSVVEAEYNLLKRTEVNIEKQHKIFNQHIIAMQQAYSNIQKEINKMEIIVEFLMAAISARNMLDSLRETQNKLLDILTNVYNGKFNIHLITPQQLQEELNVISGQIKSDLSLPVSNIKSNLQNIYHLLKIRAKIMDNYLIFEVKLPLISRDNYELYHIIPVPKQVENTMVTIVPISKYIGINLQKDSYLPLSSEDLEDCVIHDVSIHMCYLRTPIYKMKSDTDLCIKNQNNECQNNVEACKHEWVNLIKINTFFSFCCNSCQLRIICEDKVTSKLLTNSNLISIKDNCMVKTSNFTIYSHKISSSTMNISTDIQKFEIPQINEIINITFKPTMNLTSITESTQQIRTDLEERINVMKNTDVLTESISSHDIHQYSVIYGAITIGIIIGIFYICRRVYHKRSTRADELEMSSVESQPTPARRAAAAPRVRVYSPQHPHRVNKATDPIRSVSLRDNSV